MISTTRALQVADESPVELESVVTALSARFAVAAGAKQVIRGRRLDTFDRRLNAAGLTLEHRILATRDSPGERLVLGRLDGSSTVSVPVMDLHWPALADVLPGGPVRDEIARVIGIRALMVASDERRRRQQLELRNTDGKTVARVELDEPASAAADAAPARLTVRGLRGYDNEARRADRVLAGLGLRTVEHAGGPEAISAPRVPRPHREVPARVLLAGALSEFLVTMRENLPGLLDDVDTEFLHDFRVAVRRTRATLKVGRPALPEVMRTRWEPAFKSLGDVTTPVRDLDVYELDLPAMSHWLVTADRTDLDPLAKHLRSRRTVEHRALVCSLRSATFRRLVTEWDDVLTRLAATPEDVDGDTWSAGQLADRSISRAYQRVVRGGVVIGTDSPAEELHILRKRCKELRYALDVFAPLVDRVVRRRVVSDLRDLQDVLGRFQDSQVQRLALRGFAEEMMNEGTTAGAMLAMGELIGHLDVEQARARREFDETFARFERPSSLELIQQLGGGR